MKLWTGIGVRHCEAFSDKRRLAIHMAVRVQAFTCMRPKEVLTLRPENVTTKWIKVIGSKTEGSDRTIVNRRAKRDQIAA